MAEKTMEEQEVLKVIEVNGVRLHYLEKGEGKPVVLVHGNGESHTLFETEIEQLVNAGYRVFAPDSRGHGANEPLQEYHYKDMAEDMYQFIKALELSHPFYFGHSDGGVIGLLLELMHPGTVGKMAVSGTNLSPQGIIPECIAEFEEINKNTPDPLVEMMLKEPQIDPEDLRSIHVPVLVTAGSRDLILPEETKRIAEHLPDARLVIVEGEDHGSYIDHSEIMGRLLLDFFAE